MIDRHETRFALQIVRNQIGQHVWACHRLDKGTSGVLLFALSAEIASQVGQSFTDGKVEKRYLAIVRGYPDASGTIDHALSRQRDHYEWKGDNSSGEAQPAITEFRTLARVELPHTVDRYPTSRYALLELNPKTGRRHQIRRHLKHISHPIIGDATYGKGRHNRLFTELFGSQRLLLACQELTFQHPVTGDRLHIQAPLAEDFAQLVRELGW